MRYQVKIAASDLWRWDGTIDRAPYLVLGMLLVALKVILDFAVSYFVFHRAWSVLEYFAPGAGLTFAQLAATDYSFYSTMLGMSLPFAYTGSVLTIRRLRAAQLPPWLVILFYVPVANLIFFKVLSSLPSHAEGETLRLGGEAATGTQLLTDQKKSHKPEKTKLPAVDARGETHLPQPHRDSPANELAPPGAPRWPLVVNEVFYKLVPDDDKKALFVSALLPIPPAVLLGALSVLVLGQYGNGLFIALPFMISIMAPVFYGIHRPRELYQCMQVSVLSLLLVASTLLLIPFIGIICLLMAAPFAFVIGALGACLGYAIQKRLPREPRLPRIVSGIIILIPFLMLGEHALSTNTPICKVTTSIDVDASAQTVWQHVVAFSELPPPSEWYFKTGIAYPIRARIYGHGPGAVRHCEFSTGPFVEPISIWNEPKLLKFSVTSQPPPMTEMSPYKNLHPKHLDNYLLSKGGQFLLIPLGKNKTRLEGTTWYQNFMEPNLYWRLWADGIIHRIHTRVLAHVKNLSENPAEASAPDAGQSQLAQ